MIVPKGFTWCVACHCTMLYDPEGKIAPAADATMRIPQDAVGAGALTRVKSLTEENLRAMAKYFSAVSVDSRGPKTFSAEIWNTLKQKLVWRGQWDQWSVEKRQDYANGGNSRWYPKRNFFNQYPLSEEPGKTEYLELYEEGVEDENAKASSESAPGLSSLENCWTRSSLITWRRSASSQPTGTTLRRNGGKSSRSQPQSA